MVRVLARLGSLRLAVILLVLITLAATVGGILPQAPITPNADEIYRSYGVFWYRVITRLGLDDVFRGPGFLSLVGAFALNLILCMSRRARRSIVRTLAPRAVSLIRNGGGARCIERPSKDDSDSAGLLVEDALRGAGLRRIDRVTASGPTSDEVQIVGRRWRWGALAPDLVHLGILVILAGALLGGLRQEGTFVVTEAEHGRRLSACDSGESEDCLPIPYDLRVDAFGVEVYEDSTQAKTYWADLTFLDGDETLCEGRIAVNRPMTVAGFGFYPWRYGDDVDSATVRLQIFEYERNAVTDEIELRVGETVVVPGTQLWLTAGRFYRTFALTDDGEPVDLGSMPGGHSAVLVQIMGVDDAGRDVAYRDLALPFLPETDAPVSYAFLLADASVPTFLEIHYARNPGYPVVWWGFVLVMIGLAGAFYLVPSTVRASIRPDAILLRDEGRRAAGRATKRLDRIERALRRELAAGASASDDGGEEV